MSEPTLDDIQQAITAELDVLADNIHVHNENILTFYVPTGELDHAQSVVSGEVEVLETHEHEYLVKLAF